MVSVDNTKCTGCGNCVDVCLQQAITMGDDLAMINEDLCIQCGTCVNVCPVGAIRKVALANIKLSKGGETMQYGYGRGFGFRGASPSWPCVGRGRGGLPRCWHTGLRGTASYSSLAPYRPATARKEELEFLKDRAGVMKSQLEDIERRIQEIEKKN